MNKIFYFLAIIAVFIGCTDNNSTKNDGMALRFHESKFRIAQFTDIHWNNSDTANTSTREMISNAVMTEKPDLCILTGDIVTGGDPVKGWRDIVSMMENTSTPYVILMGNHDPEQLDKDSIYYLINKEGTRHIGNRTLMDIDGFKSGVIRILAEENDSTAAALYCFDSGNHYPDQILSDYDNIHLSQIRWYTDQSALLRKENGGKSLPSLAFFRICVPEYEQLASRPEKYYGNFGEPCCPSKVNSGFLSAALEQQDIMGMFVGHDHSNDFIGLWKGIALAYGRQSGVMRDDPATPQGCRVIELREGCKAFDTWIWTPAGGEENKFYYPTGVTSEMETGQYLKAMEIEKDSLQNGIHYTYIEGKGGEKSTDAMIANGEVKDTGLMKSVDITHAPAEDHFGYIFEGYFLAETKDVYIFSMMSDDGSRLFIDDECIIDLDGSHLAKPEESYVALEQGLHKIRIHYFEDYMGQQLDVMLTTRNSPAEPLPGRLLFVRRGGVY